LLPPGCLVLTPVNDAVVGIIRARERRMFA
jgi:hypothetical protein